MAREQPAESVPIGKFDILATYTYARALLDGLDDDEAKQRGMVAAIMGAQARLGIRRGAPRGFKAQKDAAEKKKKTTITAESFDKQVADKMGEFFEDVFLPTMKKLVEAGLSYDEVKRLVKIPSDLGGQDQRRAVPRSGRPRPWNQRHDDGRPHVSVCRHPCRPARGTHPAAPQQAGTPHREDRLPRHASPEGFWYDQEWHEWVPLLKGAARLRFEGEEPIDLRPGTIFNIRAHRRHRVEWPAPSVLTIWLATHFESVPAPAK